MDGVSTAKASTAYRWDNDGAPHRYNPRLVRFYYPTISAGAMSHDPGLEYLNTAPLTDPLRKEPRFQAIERELKFPN
jgi:hypothetical protein